MLSREGCCSGDATAAPTAAAPAAIAAVAKFFKFFKTTLCHHSLSVGQSLWAAEKKTYFFKGVA